MLPLAWAANQRSTEPAKKPILRLSMIRSGISPREASLSTCLVWVTRRTLCSPGIVAQYSTMWWSRNGTRTSSEWAIDARSK